MMAIMQRFGFRNNSTFFLAENMNGAMSQINLPLSRERDCWIGKSLDMRYSISTQHLKYNKTLIKEVMKPGAKYFSIIREPTSNFVSSYRYYQYLLGRLWEQFGFRKGTETKGVSFQSLERVNRYRRKRSKVNASIFDSALSHTRRSNASEKRSKTRGGAVFTFERFRLWISFESSPVSVKP